MELSSFCIEFPSEFSSETTDRWSKVNCNEDIQSVDRVDLNIKTITFRRSFPERLLWSSSEFLLLLAFDCLGSAFEAEGSFKSLFECSFGWAALSVFKWSLDNVSSQHSSAQQLSQEHSLHSDPFSSASSSSPLSFLFWFRNSSGSMPLILRSDSSLSYSSRSVLYR